MKKSEGINITNESNRRVVKGLGYYAPERVKDFRHLIKSSAQNYGNKVGFKFKDKNGNIVTKTYKEFDKDIDCLGTALSSIGLKGRHISIISENRYEWGVCYFSIVNGTGVAVPLDKYLPRNEVENLISRGKVEAIFYSPTYHGMMKDIAKTNTRIKYYICMEKLTNKEDDGKFLNVPDLIEIGAELLKKGDKSFIEAPINPSKMSILLFTSGTTSMSKGVMLSQSNIANNMESVSTVIKLYPHDVFLSLLPLHHTFENTIGLLYMVHKGVCIAYNEGIKYVAQNLKEYNVSVLIIVPAILEFIYRRIKDEIKKSGKEKLVNIMIKISDILEKVGIDIRRKIFRSIFNKLGPDLRLVVSGAAPLDPQVSIWFNKIGLKVLQGYGLTEASPVVCSNNDFVNKPGTIGHPLGGIEIAIDSPDENGIGEIIARGKNIMLGYYEDPEATAEAIDKDGWLRTGDLGIIDQDGFTTITGRAKSMIVLSNGKKAFPEEYEVLLNNIPGVKDSFVWGNKTYDGDVEICAKIVIDDEYVSYLKKKNNGESVQSKLVDHFNQAIKSINNNMPKYKIIRYFVLTSEDLVKTTTLKIKRHIEYEKTIDRLEKLDIDIRKASGTF
ncbi:MAG: AMP-binding protein, partial [Clostridiaceae bacterium]|nr:AMP-binding protein [Clostridiaceae bacterium]